MDDEKAAGAFPPPDSEEVTVADEPDPAFDEIDDDDDETPNDDEPEPDDE
jgi:hypothetical protein